MKFLDDLHEKRQTTSNLSEDKENNLKQSETIAQKKRKPSSTADEMFLEGLDKILNKDPIPTQLLQNCQDDAIDSFLKRVGEGLRKLNYRKRSEVEIKMLQLLYDANLDV